MVRIVGISDTHQLHSRITIPECDILIHCGDFTENGKRISESTSFLNWFSSQDKAKHKVFIAGNHDYLAQRDPVLFRGLIPSNCHYLQNSFVELEGLKIYGTPWTPFFFDWAFNGLEERFGMGFGYFGGPGHSASPDKEHPHLADVYSQIPTDTDILVCHGPPIGLGISTNLEGDDVGSTELRKYTPKDLKLGLCGHIHEGRGLSTDTKWYNVSSVDRRYRLHADPITVIHL